MTKIRISTLIVGVLVAATCCSARRGTIRIDEVAEFLDEGDMVTLEEEARIVSVKELCRYEDVEWEDTMEDYDDGDKWEVDASLVEEIRGGGVRFVVLEDEDGRETEVVLDEDYEQRKQGLKGLLNKMKPKAKNSPSPTAQTLVGGITTALDTTLTPVLKGTKKKEMAAKEPAAAANEEPDAEGESDTKTGTVLGKVISKVGGTLIGDPVANPLGKVVGGVVTTVTDIAEPIVPPLSIVNSAAGSGLEKWLDSFEMDPFRLSDRKLVDLDLHRYGIPFGSGDQIVLTGGTVTGLRSSHLDGDAHISMRGGMGGGSKHGLLNMGGTITLKVTVGPVNLHYDLTTVMLNSWIHRSWLSLDASADQMGLELKLCHNSTGSLELVNYQIVEIEGVRVKTGWVFWPIVYDFLVHFIVRQFYSGLHLLGQCH